MADVSATQDVLDVANARWEANRAEAAERREKLLRSGERTDRCGAWTREEFWDQLDYLERVAVHFGDLYSQVCNGGFEQWADNGYYSEEKASFLLRTLDRMGDGTAKQLKAILVDVIDVFRSHEWRGGMYDPAGLEDDEAEASYWEELGVELNEHANRFYEIDDDVLAMLDTFIANEMTADEEDAAALAGAPAPV